MKKLIFLFAAFLWLNGLLAQNIGIGTITPTERLHVIQTSDANKNVIYGYANQTSAVVDYQNTGVTGFGQGNGVAGGGGYGYGFGVKGIGSLASYGAVGVYAGIGTTTLGSITLGYNYYALYADVGTPAANRFAAVFSNGNVGIGNLVPAYKLDLTGDINISAGLIRVNGLSGTSGQVLTSNGLAVPSWKNGGTGIGFSVVKSGDVSIPNNTATQVTGFSPFFDDGSNFNLVTGEFTAPSPGVYHFDANVNWYPSNGTTVSNISYLKNNAIFDGCQVNTLTPASASYGGSVAHSINIKLIAGDIIRLQVFQVSGSPLGLVGTFASTASSFSGFKVY